MIGASNSTSGVVGYAAGASGAAQVPPGAFITTVIAHSSGAGSMTIFGGASVPIVATQILQLYFSHQLWQAQGATGQASTEVLFTGTDSYFVEYVTPRG